MNPENAIKQIAQETANCVKCQLHFSRKNSVPGEGPANAEIMFIGEGPGFHENEQGRPFVGASGKFLDELVNSIGLKREQVFIANVVKCRPPGNRDPQQEELDACSSFLNRQIEIINPRVVVTLGRFSMARYFSNAKISQIHGKPKRQNGRLIVPMYHPAAALHQRRLKPVIEEDFKKLAELMKSTPQVNDAEPKRKSGDENVKQLNMF